MCLQAVFNILCEQPETVAAFLVPRVRTTVARHSTSSYIRFLTPQRAIVRFLMAPFHIHRFFDGQGIGELLNSQRMCTLFLSYHPASA